MGTFLVPRQLLLEPLQYHARVDEVPLVEARDPLALPPGDNRVDFRIGPCREGMQRRRRYKLFRALAEEFGVTPRFIHVWLMRYRPIDDDETPTATVRPQLRTG